MAHVVLKTFINASKYKELIEKYNNIFHTEKQIVYSYDLEDKFNFIKTKRHCKILIDDRDINIDTCYTKNMSYLLEHLGYFPRIKWFRTRSIAKLDYEIQLCLDYVKDFGYIIQLSKIVENSKKEDLTKIELGNFLESIDIDITNNEELNKRYEEYILNYEKIIDNINEEIFLK